MAPSALSGGCGSSPYARHCCVEPGVACPSEKTQRTKARGVPPALGVAHQAGTLAHGIPEALPPASSATVAQVEPGCLKQRVLHRGTSRVPEIGGGPVPLNRYIFGFGWRGLARLL